MKINRILLTVFFAGILFSCENKDVTYPDFDYTTVYFANQYPLRTLELGEDTEVDNSLDNEHKVKITATMGGVYSNTVERTINIEVDESLCDGVSFDDGTELLPMPSNYYNLESDQIIIESGNILGGVVVELTDAFFEDPLTISHKYAIPVVMTEVANADSILSGTSTVENPNRLVSSDWSVAPKDYVMYVIKYVNPYHAKYLRRGVDEINDGTNTVTEVRHEEYVEYDEVIGLTTLSYDETEFVPEYTSPEFGHSIPIPVKLGFNESNECIVDIVSSSIEINDTVSVNNITADGSGNFVKDSEKLGGLDRNAIYLDYVVDFQIETRFPQSGSPTIYEDIKYSTKDTLVCRNRGVSPEYYSITTE